jgi:DNA mismatch endonuclease, patch repair protein
LRPERRLRRALRMLGVPFRANAKDLPGTPDAVLRRHPVAIFVDGCFWHGCPQHYREPKTRTEFWAVKIAANRRRDRRADRRLRRLGYAVVRIWEHDVTGK